MNATPFHAAIRDRPEDDTPRLVYADWLDEHGDSDRAEFIRVQCALAAAHPDDPRRDDLEDREADLLAEYEYTWLGEAGQHVLDWRFRRGFIEEIGGSAAVTMAAWDRLRQTHPLRAVTWNELENADPQSLRDMKKWEGLTGVTIQPVISDAWLMELANWPRLRTFEALRFSRFPSQETLVSVILDSMLPSLVGGPLRCFHMSSVRDTYNPVERLISCGIASQLHSLQLQSSVLSANDISQLLSHSAFTELRRLSIREFHLVRLNDGSEWRPFPQRNLIDLDLGVQSLPGQLHTVLTASPMLGGLRRFSWTNDAWSSFPTDELEFLSEMPQLEHLTLGIPQMGDFFLESLQNCLPSRLRSIRFSEASITHTGWEMIQPRLDPTRLRSLHLEESYLESGVGERIWNSPICAKLKHLGLNLCRSPSGMIAPWMNSTAGSRRLQALALVGEEYSDEQWQALSRWLGSPAATRLRNLRLRCDDLTPKGQSILAHNPTMPSLRRVVLDLLEVMNADLADWLTQPMFQSIQAVHFLSYDDNAQAILQHILYRPGLERLRQITTESILSDGMIARMQAHFGPDILTPTFHLSDMEDHP